MPSSPFISTYYFDRRSQSFDLKFGKLSDTLKYLELLVNYTVGSLDGIFERSREPLAADVRRSGGLRASHSLSGVYRVLSYRNILVLFRVCSINFNSCVVPFTATAAGNAGDGGQVVERVAHVPRAGGARALAADAAAGGRRGLARRGLRREP